MASGKEEAYYQAPYLGKWLQAEMRNPRQWSLDQWCHPSVDITEQSQTPDLCFSFNLQNKGMVWILRVILLVGKGKLLTQWWINANPGRPVWATGKIFSPHLKGFQPHLRSPRLIWALEGWSFSVRGCPGLPPLVWIRVGRNSCYLMRCTLTSGAHPPPQKPTYTSLQVTNFSFSLTWRWRQTSRTGRRGLGGNFFSKQSLKSGPDNLFGGRLASHYEEKYSEQFCM